MHAPLKLCSLSCGTCSPVGPPAPNLLTHTFPAGFACTRQELSQDIKQLYNTGLFESVNARVLPKKGGKFKVAGEGCVFVVVA
jgi:hypothetical protein